MEKGMRRRRGKSFRMGGRCDNFLSISSSAVSFVRREEAPFLVEIYGRKGARFATLYYTAPPFLRRFSSLPPPLLRVYWQAPGRKGGRNYFSCVELRRRDPKAVEEDEYEFHPSSPPSLSPGAPSARRGRRRTERQARERE